MGGWLKLQNLLFFNQFYYLPAPQAEKKIIGCFMKLLCVLFCRFVVVFAVPEPVVVLWLCLWLWLCFVFVAKLVAVPVFVAVFGAGACGCGCANWNLVPKYDENLQWATCFGLNVYALLGRLSGFGVQQFV